MKRPQQRKPRKLPIRLWHDKVRKILGQEALDQLKRQQAARAGETQP